jgi:hypothetical protein
MTREQRRSKMRKTLPFIWLYTTILALFALIALLSDRFAGVALQLTFWSGMLLLFTGLLFLRFDSTYVTWFDEFSFDLPIGAAGLQIGVCSVPLLAMALIVSANHADNGCRPTLLFPQWMCQ